MTISIAFIGTGWFAAVHADILTKMDGVKFAAACGTSLDKAERFASKYSAAGYDHVERMLDSVKPDAVFISVPPFAHGPIEAALLERRIPFFIEKPLGLNLDVPRQTVIQVQQSGLLTSVGYHMRYLESTARALDIIRGTRVGMSLGYWTGTMPGVAWWRREEGSGGQFIEQTTHIVDLLRYTVGEVSEVYAAYASTIMHEREQGVTVPDVGTVTLKLANGTIANISNACMLPVEHRAELHILTEEGVLELSRKGLQEQRRGTTIFTENQHNPYEAEVEAFLHALRTGDRSGIRSTYEDAFRTQQVTVAALESARNGTPIRL
ncbi:Gfo/Idh/MocA family protein [Paenibacillus chartarius]|uniref:Gfo/Idh/MocA family protein n=1 Tax=Paenibacillus chartarius TaxID=747481 RepID=A0ABV6DKI1_9BACL